MRSSSKFRALASGLLVSSLFTFISSSTPAQAAGPTVKVLSANIAGAGAVITLTGSGFSTLAGGNSVTFNGASSLSVTYVSSNNTLRATVPSGAAATGYVRVTTSGGTSPTNSDNAFTFVLPPTITSFTPTVGNLSTDIEITAENAGGAQVNTVVKIGTVTAQLVDPWNQTTKKIKIRPGANTITGPITIVTSGGVDATAWGNNPAYTATGSNFTVYPVPTISSFTPTDVFAGTSVAITGTNFVSGQTTVSFGSKVATGVHWTSETQVEATVPSDATTNSIKVTTPGGDVFSTSPYIFHQAPTILSFTPTTLGVGTQVTITGTNFTGLSEVKFGGYAATVDSSNDTTIRTTVPDGVNVNGTISATTPGGTATSGTYTYSSGPTLASFSPTSLNAGTVVTIKGLALGTTTAVFFNGVPGTNISATANQVTVTAPAGTTSGLITIITLGGTATSTASFIYYGTSTPIKTTCPVLVPTTTNKTTITLGSCTVLTKVALPIISGFTSTSGAAITSAAKNTSIRIVGTNLTGTSSIKFHGISAASFTVNSETQITVKVPTSATSGTVSVTTAGGTANSSGTLTITA